MTFAGVPAADLASPSSFAAAQAMVVGAPYDGGTSHRPGARFGPQAIRQTDYLPHNGRRPHLALGVDPPVELEVVDVGDVSMPAVEAHASLKQLEDALAQVAGAGCVRVVGETTPWPGPTPPAWLAMSASAGCRSSTSTPMPTPPTSSSGP